MLADLFCDLPWYEICAISAAMLTAIIMPLILVPVLHYFASFRQGCEENREGLVRAMNNCDVRPHEAESDVLVTEMHDQNPLEAESSSSCSETRSDDLLEESFDDVTAPYTLLEDTFDEITATEDTLSLARKHYNAKCYRKALQIVEKELKKYSGSGVNHYQGCSKHFDFLVLKCDSELVTGLRSRALQTAKILCESFPKNAKSHILLSEAHESFSNMGSALAVLRDGLTSETNGSTLSEYFTRKCQEVALSLRGAHQSNAILAEEDEPHVRHFIDEEFLFQRIELGDSTEHKLNQIWKSVKNKRTLSRN